MGVGQKTAGREELARELHAHTEAHRTEPIPWERWHPLVQATFLETADQIIGSAWLRAHEAEVAAEALQAAVPEPVDTASPGPEPVV